MGRCNINQRHMLNFVCVWEDFFWCHSLPFSAVGTKINGWTHLQEFTTHDSYAWIPSPSRSPALTFPACSPFPHTSHQHITAAGDTEITLTACTEAKHMSIWTVFALIWRIRVFSNFLLGNKYMSSCPKPCYTHSSSDVAVVRSAAAWVTAVSWLRVFFIKSRKTSTRGEKKERERWTFWACLRTEIKTVDFWKDSDPSTPSPFLMINTFCSSKDVLLLSSASEMEQINSSSHDKNRAW